MTISPAAESQLDLKLSLSEGLTELGLAATATQQQQLLDYLDLLAKWNKVYNLSGIKSPATMVSAHLLDSLSISRFIDAATVLDIGTGAGLPGIPLAILHPDKEFILLDSNGKKTRFLFQVKLALELKNIRIENKRIENYQCPEQIDIVICRAFSNLSALVEVSSKAVGGPGRLLAMKGTHPTDELENLPATCNVLAVEELTVPGVDGKRHIVDIALKIKPI